jgi:TP901 family phage tail tape measure protein
MVMFGSIIHVGINFITQNLGKALSGLNQLAGAFQQAHQQAQIFANGVNTVVNQTNNGMSRLRKALQHNWANEYRSLVNGLNMSHEDALESITKKYDNQWREIANKYQSLVMGSVALSMSGIGLKNVGLGLGGFLKESVDQATQYELVMKQISWYGKETVKTDQDRLKLNREIFQLGRDLPVTTSEVATSMLTAMKTGYSDLNDAIAMGKEASKIQFMSMGKLKGEDSLKFVNLARQLMGVDAQKASSVTDAILKTADVSALDPEGLFRAMMSSRSAKENLKLDNASFFALLGGMGNVLNERGAGEALNVFSRGQLQAFGSKPDSKRGKLWNMLGIDLEKEGDDMLAVIDKVVNRSHELWGDTFTRREKLMDIFGNDALTLLSAYEVNKRNSGMTLTEMRNQIQAATGTKDARGKSYSDNAVDTFTNSMYGLQEQLKGVREQFYILFGLAIGPGFNLIVKQLTNMLSGINRFLEDHPKIARYTGYILGMAAAFTVAAGSLLLFAGLIVGTYSSIMAFTTNMIRNTRVAELLGMQMSTTGDLINNKFINPAKKALMFMGRMALASGLLYLAWRYDFLGLRTYTESFTTRFQIAMKRVDETMNLFRNGSVKDFVSSFQDLGNRGFWGGLTRGIVSFMALMDGVFQAWSGNTISKDMYDKLKGAGLLKALELILDVKQAVTDLWTGFVAGVSEGAKILWPILKPLWEFAKWAYEKVTGILEHFGLMKNVQSGLTSDWQKMGGSIGLIVGGLIALKIGVKAWSVALGTPLKAMWNIYKVMRLLISGGKNFGNWFKGGGPGRMAGGGSARAANGAFNGLMRIGGWVFGTKQTRLAANALNNLRNKNRTFIPQPNQLNLPGPTNRNAAQNRMAWLADKFGGGEMIQRNGRANSVRSRGFLGRLTDTLLGRRLMVERAANGTLGVRGRDAQGRGTYRFLTQAEKQEFQQRGALRRGGLFRNIGNFWEGWVKHSSKQGIVSGGTRTLLRGGGGLLGGIGKLGLSLGKGLLGGLGKVLLGGVPFLFKAAFRLIPIIGWALSAWEIISLIWENWEPIKKGAAKAWNWIKTEGVTKMRQAWEWVKTDGVMYLGQFSDWFVNTGLPVATQGLIDGFSAAWNWAKDDGVKYLGEFADWWYFTALPAIGKALVDAMSSAWTKVKENLSDSTWLPDWMKKLLGIEVKPTGGTASTGNTLASEATKTFGLVQKGATFFNYATHPVDAAITDIGGNLIKKAAQKALGYPSSHVGSKVEDEGLVNVAPGEVILRDRTVRDFENYVASSKAANRSAAPAGGGDTSINFAPGAVTINLANASQGEIQRGARQLFEEFKRMVETENMRNYRSARAKG